MWKYTHTDEMYHSLVNRNNSTELFHSDVYLGQEFSDGIKHFKYIKRERKNGKWVYYYKDNKLSKLKSKQDKELEALRAANKVRGYGDDSNTYYRKDGKEVGKDAAYQKISRDVNRASHDYARAKYRSDKREKRYALPIAALNAMSDGQHKAKKAVEKALNNLKNKKKKKSNKPKKTYLVK